MLHGALEAKRTEEASERSRGEEGKEAGGELERPARKSSLSKAVEAYNSSSFSSFSLAQVSLLAITRML